MCNARSIRVRPRPMAYPAMNKHSEGFGAAAAIRQTLQEVAGAPDDAPRSMPGAFYTDPALFAHETQTVLRSGWHCAGRADELPAQGDYMTLDLLGEPLLIVRDGGAIRALANVCQHRGMPLVQGRGTAKRFVCRYHAWA